MMRFSITVLAAIFVSSSAFQTPQLSASRRDCRTTLQVTTIEDWKLLENNSVVGKVKNHPELNDGDVVSTSPLTYPARAVPSALVTSTSGSEYLLGQTSINSNSRNDAAMNDAGPMGVSRDEFLICAAATLAAGGIFALGVTAGGSSSFNSAGQVQGQVSMPAFTTTSQDQVVPEWTKYTPGIVEPTGDNLKPREVSDLFGLWNQALKTGNPDTVAMRYAKNAVLLPTKSNIPRSDYNGIRDYFVHFLENKPEGKILESYIQTQPGRAMDVGIYEFAFEDGTRVRARYSFIYTNEDDGAWRIKHHHSSGMPETSGQVITEPEVKQLFSLWNDALLTGDSDAVTRRYAKGAVLLPTVSDIPRTTYAGIKDYFDHFLELKPDGKIIESYVSIGENWCKDVGIYEFKKGTDGTSVRARYSFVYVFEDDEWKISHHHSSLMPEGLLAKAKSA